MSVVAGLAPDERGEAARAAVHLGSLLARSFAVELVVCAVVVTPWPSPERMDTEYRAYLDRAAGRALDDARGRLPADLRASFVVHHARSAPAGLLTVADEVDAAAVAVGSSAGVLGQVALGSVSDRLLHSSGRPVAVAARGFRSRPANHISRITAAFDGSDSASDLVIAAAELAARAGAGLRLAAFAVRPTSAFLGSIEADAEQLVVDQWVKSTDRATELALANVRELPEVPRRLEIAVGRGHSWAEALDDVEWDRDDLLLVGSSTSGPLARVFLGSHASKLVRHSPVPTLVLPRTAAADLAELADQG